MFPEKISPTGACRVDRGLYRRFRRVLATVFVIGSLSLEFSPQTPPRARPTAASTVFFRGVNFTAEGPESYNSKQSALVLEQLAGYGVNAVALVPFGFERLGETAIHYPDGWESDERISGQAAMVHQRSMRLMLKPQIWVPRRYPGDLDFASESERNEWFRQYRQFINHYADLATQIHADLFCIGVELARLTVYEQEWRRLILEIRQHYSGPLVYAAASGRDFEETAFWDSLDYIGLDEYYPLPDDLSTDDLLHKIEKVRRRFDKPVIFTEVGFTNRKGTHRAPWDESLPEKSDEEQARCYEAIFKAVYEKPWFQGLYWWKIGANGFGGPNDLSHTPWGKPAMKTLEQWYRNRTR